MLSVTAERLDMQLLWFEGISYMYMHNLYPTYDVDQSYRQGNIFNIALWYS